MRARRFLHAFRCPLDELVSVRQSGVGSRWQTVTLRDVGAAHSPDLMIRGADTYRILKDRLGSPRVVVNTVTGVVEQRVTFDAWGVVKEDWSSGGFIEIPFGFAGGLWERETGLVRFGARDYGPEVGRWISKDPIRFSGGDPNLYAYVGNEPVNFIDPC